MPPADIAGNSLEHKGKNRPSSRAVGSLFAAYLGRSFSRVRGFFPSCFRSRTIQPRDVPDTNPTSIPRRYRSCHTVHNRWAERTRPARTTRNRRRVCSRVETFLATCWPFAPLLPGAGVFVRSGTVTRNMFAFLANFHGIATCIMTSFSSSSIPQSDGTYFS